MELWLAQLCACFPGRLPTEIVGEIDRLPVGMLEDVVSAKGYSEAYHMVKAADTAEARRRLPQAPVFTLVQENELLLAAEELEKRTHGDV